MSEHCDVLVIGGGIIGLSVALRVRQSGVSVTLLERGDCGREASWAGAGVIAPAKPQRHGPMSMIQRASVERYAGFCEEIREVSGIDPEYDRCGAIEFLTTEQFVRMARSDVRVMSDVTTEEGSPVVEVLSSEQVRALEPGVTGEAVGYLRNRVTAQVRNPRILQGLRVACERLGVRVRENEAVGELIAGTNRVDGARTQAGAYSADRTVLCAGAWSSEFAPQAIAELVPVHPVRGQMVLVERDRPLLTHVIKRRKHYLIPRRDGRILVGVTLEPDSGFEAGNTAKGINSMLDGAMAMVPSLSDSRVAGMWSGFRPGTPDTRPHIGFVPGWEGLIAATGHYRLGVTLAPVTADIVRDLIVDGSTPFDLAHCAPGRAFSTSAAR